MTVHGIKHPPPEDRQNRHGSTASNPVPHWKRALDILCIVAALPLVLPLGILIALMIKLASPGPAFFKQERIGFCGRRFTCLKFRTMKVNASSEIHRGHLLDLMTANQPMTKLDAAGDHRLIPCGLALRSLGLDELPQLINVLRGEMSLVGPRPSIPYEYEKFQPRHLRRFETLPGLTGLWQVSGKNKTTFEQMIDFDLQYTEQKSLLLDMKILARTIPVLLTQAYDLKVRGKKGATGPATKAAGARNEEFSGTKQAFVLTTDKRV